jgi:hypothetical protein
LMRSISSAARSSSRDSARISARKYSSCAAAGREAARRGRAGVEERARATCERATSKGARAPGCRASRPGAART